MSLIDKLQYTYVNLNSVLNNINIGFVEKGLNKVDSFTSIIDEIRKITRTLEKSELIDSIIKRTVSKIENEDVNNVRPYAFFNCNSLTTISFPACTNIGNYAFAYCDYLRTVSFPTCTNINSSAFYSCKNLISVNFPACTNIGNNAFYYCSKLTTANFPACTNIGSFAFGDCSKLTTANFPTCTSIGNHVFMYCSNLTSVNFPACTSIRYSAFMYCSKLTTANFSACTNIEHNAFKNCTSLVSLILANSSVAKLNKTNAFTNTPMSKSSYTGTFGSIYVPASLVDAYKSATNWTAYAARITSITT